MQKTSGETIMLKFLILTYLFFNSVSQAGLVDKCRRIFKTQNVTYSLSDSAPLKNHYSQIVFEQVYQQLSLLEGDSLSTAETQKYILQLESLIQYLETNSVQKDKRLELLDPYLSPALKKIPDIISFIKSESALKYESLDTQTILQLALSTFSRHLHAYLSHPKAESLDWPRFREILESISSFKTEKPAFSLYKIYRSVREKYSIQEYINCK